MKHKVSPAGYFFILLAIAATATAGYLGYTLYTLYNTNQAQAATIEQYELALTTASSTILTLESDLSNLRSDLEALADSYEDERDRSEEFEEEIRDLARDIDEFERLVEIDEELLAKYSRAYFLNENYTPSDLDRIDDKWILDRPANPIEDQRFHGDAMRYLERMLERAERAGHDLRVVSAYRSFDEQQQLKGQFTQVYGEGANRFSADQGFSEHQLGTAVDLTTPAVGGTFQTFADTEAYKWLLDNAHRYGFILSYPEGNDFYIFEPWHWRFVGRDLARHLDRNEDETFYTMDQRDINEYLLEIFE